MNTHDVLPGDPSYLKAALADFGLSETIGRKHNPRVVQLFALAGHPKIKDDETAWCAAAIGGWLKEGGLPNTGSLMARSYVKYGKPCDLKKRVPRGAIVVWPRGKPPSGHVNICLEDDGTYLTCIGGNQSNGRGGGVTISREKKSHAIAARLPISVAVQLPKAQPKPKPPSDEEQPFEAPADIPPARPVPAAPQFPKDSYEYAAAKAIAAGDTPYREVWSVQGRLKLMNYNPGGVDAVWGGLTGGAISGFINDRQMAIDAPTSVEMFFAIHDALKAELTEAEAEPFKRPVSVERATITPTELAPKLPEVKAAQKASFWSKIQGWWSAVFGGVTATGVATNVMTAKETVDPIKSWFGETVPYFIGAGFVVAIIVIAIILAKKASGAANEAVDVVTQDFREGSRS